MKTEEEEEKRRRRKRRRIYVCRNRIQTPQIIILSNTLFQQSSAKNCSRSKYRKKSHQQDMKLNQA